MKMAELLPMTFTIVNLQVIGLLDVFTPTTLFEDFEDL